MSISSDPSRSNLRRRRRRPRAIEAASATLALATRQQQPWLQRYQPQQEDPAYFDNNSEYFYYEQQPHNFGFLQWLGGILLAVCKVLLLLSLSAVSYGIFYQRSMPTQLASKELHFDYTRGSDIIGLSSAEQIAAAAVTYNPIALFRRQHREEEEEHVEEKRQQSVPTATVDLLAKHNEWQAFAENVLPAAPLQQRLLQAGQAYYIDVALTLPESQANKDAGMFGVVTELYSSSLSFSLLECSESTTSDSDNDEKSCRSDGLNGAKQQQQQQQHKLLAVSRRSYRFPHQSAWISTIAKMLLLMPLLIGALEETRTVTSPVFRQYVESADYPLVSCVCYCCLRLFSVHTKRRRQNKIEVLYLSTII